MEGKVAVLGSEDFVMAFSALGLDPFAVEPEPDAVAESAKDIIKNKYALVVVAENVAPMAEEVFEDTMKKPMPCVVVVPFMSKSTGYATESLKRSLMLATGIDILGS